MTALCLSFVALLPPQPSNASPTMAFDETAQVGFGEFSFGRCGSGRART